MGALSDWRHLRALSAQAIGGVVVGVSATSGLSAHGELLQLPLETSPMNAELLSGVRDIAIAVGEHALDVLPLDAGERRCRELG